MRLSLICASALLLAACQPDPMSDTPDLQASCRAPALQDLIGQPRATLDMRSLPEPVRVIGPDMAVTMDYRPDRLNIDYDRNAMITRVYCG